MHLLHMANDSDIERCLGSAAARYAANKHRGGSSGNKGTRYEDFFIAYKVVEAAAQLLSDPFAPDPHVKGQDYGFVDDARIASQSATDYFQLKNKDSVSWTAGDHPIELDFAYQFKLSSYLQEQAPSTNLVVPTAELAAVLQASIPDSIKAHSLVHHFPWYSTPNRLVFECAELRGWLKSIAHVEEPTNDALSGALGALMFACIEYPDGATIRTLVECAQRVFPGQLRLLPTTENWEDLLRADFKGVLAGIQGLTYSAKRGFFCWSGFGTSGVFGYSVLSEEFTTFQNDIVQFVPRNFEEFEGVLP